jgi:hypothetical protein
VTAYAISGPPDHPVLDPIPINGVPTDPSSPTG